MNLFPRSIWHKISIGSGNGWHRIGSEPLPESVISQFTYARPNLNVLTQYIPRNIHMFNTLSRVYTPCARMRAYTRAHADCRRRCLYFCRRLRPAHTRAYADCRRQSSNLLNFQGQRRPAQAFQPITKALQGHRGLTRCSDRDVCGRIPTYTLACLYFYPRRNLRYAVATHRQPRAWTSAPAAGAMRAWSINPALWSVVVDINKMQCWPISFRVT